MVGTNNYPQNNRTGPPVRRGPIHPPSRKENTPSNFGTGPPLDSGMQSSGTSLVVNPPRYLLNKEPHITGFRFYNRGIKEQGSCMI